MKKFDFTDPQKWNFKAIVVLGGVSEEAADEAEMIIGDMLDANDVMPQIDVEHWDSIKAKANTTPDSRFDQRHTCDHCGAAFKFGAAYENAQGEIAIVGHTCATNKLNLNAHEYEMKKIKKQLKARKHYTKSLQLLTAMKEEDIKLYEALHFNNQICKNIRSYYMRKHHISEKQKELVLDIAAGIVPDWAKPKIVEKELPAEDAPNGRVTIQATILTTKWQDDAYGGGQIKMLVKGTERWKAWGTLPSSISDDYSKGDLIEFTATFEPKQDDSTFAFFKRPSKASIVKSAA